MAGRRRGRYPPEYKERIVELVRAGRSPGSRGARVRAFAADDPELGQAGGPGRGPPAGAWVVTGLEVRTWSLIKYLHGH